MYINCFKYTGYLKYNKYVLIITLIIKVLYRHILYYKSYYFSVLLVFL